MLVVSIMLFIITIICFWIAFKDGNGEILVIGMFSMVVGLVFISLWLSEKSCHATAGAMQVESKWSFFTSCMIKKGDKYYPLNNYLAEEKVTYE